MDRTHCFFEDGKPSVFCLPHEYPDGDVRELPEGFWGCPHLWDAEAEAFVPDVPAIKAGLWAAVKSRRERAETAGCETPLGRMDTDPISQQRVTGAVTMAQLALGRGEPFAIDWTMQDNSIAPHDAAAIITAGLAMGRHVAVCHAIARALREVIEAPTATSAELVALDIEAAAWPDKAAPPAADPEPEPEPETDEDV